MKHAIYHTGLDNFVYRKQVPYDPDKNPYDRDDREMRFLFCEFSTEFSGPLINIYNGDLDHLLMCHVFTAYKKVKDTDGIRYVSNDHQKLYEYLVEIGLEHIRFIPQNEDKSLNWKRSFTLEEWS